MDEHIQNEAMAIMDAQRIEQPQQDQPEPAEKPASEQPEPKKAFESTKDYNLRVLAERAEQAERKAAEYQRYIESLQKQSQQQNHALAQEAYSDNDLDFDADISDDDYLDGKQLKKVTKTLKQELRQMKQQLQQVNQVNQASAAEMRLRSQYADFDAVVTKENLKTFAKIYPEEYQSIKSNPDLYGMGKTAYTLLKRLGIADSEMEMQEQRLAENKSKPRAAASVGPQISDSPMARLGEYDRRVLTEERKAQLRKQVEEAKRYR